MPFTLVKEGFRAVVVPMKRLLNIHGSIGPSEIKMVLVADGSVLNTNIRKAKLAISNTHKHCQISPRDCA